MNDKICKRCGANLTMTKGRHRANCPIKNELEKDDNGLVINPGVVGPTSTNEIGDDGGGVATLDNLPDDSTKFDTEDTDPGNNDYPDSGDIDHGGSD